MILLVKNIKTTVDEGSAPAIGRAIKKAGIPGSAVLSAGIAKTSVDARHGQVSFVHSVSLTLAPGIGPEHFENRPDLSLKKAAELTLTHGSERMDTRPVVVGFGPAGMFAALLLAQHGYRPLVLERGPAMEERIEAVERFWQEGILMPEANVQFGEGGAGTFSDGKLTTRIGDELCDKVLEELVRFGAPEDILWRAKPHIGTDLLRGVVRSIREEIIRLGGEVRFNTPVTGLRVERQALKGLVTPGGEIPCGALILAVGHSARDTFEALAACSIPMQAKPFSVGVRIEHLQEEIDRAVYGRYAGHKNLWPAEYQLSNREGERAAYTFCMCPGGTVVAAASGEGEVVVNGMSEYKRDGKNANSAFVVSVGPQDFGDCWRDGVRFQQELEHAAFCRCHKSYRAPAQTVGGFLRGERIPLGGKVLPTYPLGVEEASLREILPAQVCSMMERSFPILGRRLHGFDDPQALLTGVETRTSSPVRMIRGTDYQSTAASGLYPCGEGAGYAGGIMSAAVDGLRCAGAVISRFSPPLESDG